MNWKTFEETIRWDQNSVSRPKSWRMMMMMMMIMISVYLQTAWLYVRKFIAFLSG